jgi:hypothetical protein
MEMRMRKHFAGALLLCGLPFFLPISAQNVDPKLASEVGAVRAELARSYDGLLKYVWTEQVDVLVGGKLKSSNSMTCGYGSDGKIIRTPVGPEKDKPTSKRTSNRPLVRSKGETQDYIERAISRIRQYVPPDPQVIDHLVTSGQASLGPSSGGASEVRMTYYFQAGDSIVFTYDSASKRLLRTAVSSNLSGPKDPVTLDATFETLPGNVNHLATATLKAPAKKVQVNVKNIDYKKLVN